jgi:hypothetical protein
MGNTMSSSLSEAATASIAHSRVMTGRALLEAQHRATLAEVQLAQLKTVLEDTRGDRGVSASQR